MKYATTLAALFGLLSTVVCADPGPNPYMGSRMPYDAFDALPKTEVPVEGAVLDVAFAPGELALENSDVLDWLRKSAAAVSVYYGKFPVPRTRVLIVPVPGRGVRSATTFGYRGPAIRLALGTDSTHGALRADWKAVHEMVHLALPDLADEHVWLAEGLAVYVESIARVQAGDLPPEKIWHEFVRDMPKGLPRSTDGGLDGTTDWGRTYWGGAIFCLLADIEMRKRSGNTLGLQDAMRGVLAAGGTHDKDWLIERIIRDGDSAVGMTVLADLYRQMGQHAFTPQLAPLWRDLGIIDLPEGARFDDRAAMAGIRKAITARR